MQKTTNFATIYRTARIALAVFVITLFAIVSASAQTTLVGWGSNDSGQLDIPADADQFTAISAGGSFAMGLRANGTVECWGGNDQGQCNVPAGLTGVVQISAGDKTSMALKTDGKVVVWGRALASTPNLTGVIAIAAGAPHMAALQADGTVVAWGNNFTGSLQISGLDHVKAISGAFFHTIAIRDDGTTTSLPDGNDVIVDHVAAVAGGRWHNVAVRQDGSVVAWTFYSGGYSYYGQDLVPPEAVGVIAVAAGLSHSIALRSDRTVVCWGDNRAGQCDVPAGLGQVTAVSGGDTFSLALRVPTLEMSSNVSTFYSGSTAAVKATVNFTQTSAFPRTVSIASSDPSAISAASVVVPAGAQKATIVLNHMPVSNAKTVSLTATCGGLTARMPLSLQPIYVKSVSFDHNDSVGGINQTGYLTLNVPTKKTLTVALAGDSPNYLNVESSTTVAAASTRALFSLSTSQVPTNTTVHVVAQAGGAPFTAPLTIIALPIVKEFKLASSSIYGNQKTIGTVTLSLPAPDGGMSVGIYVNGPDCLADTSIFVPKGQTKGTVEIVSADVAVESTTPISARTDFSEVIRPLTVKPMVLQSLTLSPSTIRTGETSAVTITLKDIVAIDTDVDLSMAKAGVANLPAKVTVLAGSKTATVTLTATASSGVATSKVTGSRAGVAKTQLLTVNP